MSESSAPIVVHATSVHPVGDHRIHGRQCASLAAAGFDVRLVVLGPVPDSSAPGVTVVSAGERLPRLRRMTVGALKMLRTIRAQRPAIVHLHDPELMVLIPLLRLLRIQVVVDLHEDPTLQLLDKQFPLGIGRLGLLGYRAVLAASRPLVSLFVVAWPHPRPPDDPSKVIEIHNYPGRDEFALPNPRPYEDRDPIAVSVGSNNLNRCIMEMIDAAGRLGSDGVIEVVGSITPPNLLDDHRPSVEASGVRLSGRLDHDGVAAALDRARVGLCLLYPTRQYRLAEPTKLFEYLSVGLPVVGVDMGPTAEVVRKHDCGILVDPKDPAAIADAVRKILGDPELAAGYRRRAREAGVHYTWEAQADKLVSAYHRLLA